MTRSLPRLQFRITSLAVVTNVYNKLREEVMNQNHLIRLNLIILLFFKKIRDLVSDFKTAGVLASPWQIKIH